MGSKVDVNDGPVKVQHHFSTCQFVKLSFSRLLTSLVDWVFGHVCYVLSRVLQETGRDNQGRRGAGQSIEGQVQNREVEKKKEERKKTAAFKSQKKLKIYAELKARRQEVMKSSFYKPARRQWTECSHRNRT